MIKYFIKGLIISPFLFLISCNDKVKNEKFQNITKDECNWADENNTNKSAVSYEQLESVINELKLLKEELIILKTQNDNFENNKSEYSYWYVSYLDADGNIMQTIYKQNGIIFDPLHAGETIASWHKNNDTWYRPSFYARVTKEVYDYWIE